MKVSEMDELHYRLAREHILAGERTFFRLFASAPDRWRALEIGPRLFLSGFDRMDIVPRDGVTIVADITKRTPIEDSTYDGILCMDVLEHCLQPFDAIAEMRRILKPGGLLVASTPFNFREHHPRPDCWRFGRDGWKVLLKDWDAVELDVLMTPDRFLMPLHINISARCNKTKDIDASTIEFTDYDT